MEVLLQTHGLDSGIGKTALSIAAAYQFPGVYINLQAAEITEVCQYICARSRTLWQTII